MLPKRRRAARRARQARSQETVRAIVQAGERILLERGKEGFAVARVAQLAGVSKGTLYEYFRSADHLLRAVEEQSWASVAAELAGVVADADDDLDASIDRIVTAALRVVGRRAAVHGLTLVHGGADADARRELVRELGARIAAEIDARIPASRRRCSDSAMAAEVLVAVVPFLASLGVDFFREDMETGRLGEATRCLVRGFLLRDVVA